jgi:hypothetical protein
MRQSETLLHRTDDAVSVVGDPVAVYGSRTFTAAIHTSNLTGIVVIEAALAADPQDHDWFPVVGPLVYPRADTTETCVALGISFTGRFSHIRARLYRPGFGDAQSTSGQLGYVDRVLLGRCS